MRGQLSYRRGMPKFRLTVKGVKSSSTISVTAAKIVGDVSGISFWDDANTLIGRVPQESLVCVIDAEALK